MRAHWLIGAALSLLALGCPKPFPDDELSTADDAGGAGGDGGGAGTGGEAGGSGSGGGNPQACTSSANCPTDQVCSFFDGVTHAAYCQPRNPGAASVTATCATDADCSSALCLLFGHTCTESCATSSDCGANGLCEDADLGGGVLGHRCYRKCAHDADCPTNADGRNACAPSLVGGGAGDCTSNCTPGKDPGCIDFGGATASPGACEVGMAYAGLCTRLCAPGGTDCSGALPVCNSVPFDVGGNAVNFNVCTTSGGGACTLCAGTCNSPGEEAGCFSQCLLTTGQCTYNAGSCTCN